uniref:Serine/arginine repetitive matrix 4 n=1 Tax=Neogobius melanostomus TaxID=47308 RepID=A0A8C6UXR9_9GOBI
MSASGLVGEKQLFEKFWKGTFKAVATPRLESVIVASIIARTRAYIVISLCLSLYSLSCDEDLSPRPKAKKKKRKSQRKRKRKRSVSKIMAILHRSCSPGFKLELMCAYLQTLSSKSGSHLLEAKDAGLILRQREEAPHDYDSGNDTSSPPSCKTAGSELKRSQSAPRLTSPVKHKFTERDNGSDSGNSVTSYASLCKTYGDDSLSASRFSPNGKRYIHNPLNVKSCCSRRGSRACRRAGKRSRTSSRSSSSSSRYSGSYRHYSRSSSLSSYRWDPRVSTLSHSHKVSGKRRRRKSYSPMKKRRRDSPSHLEARRITSARKRPIPYFRRSPSSSSSVSSWSSLFSRCRSRSAPYRQSRSRGRSYSSYRSYSRSSSWNSIFGSRSRSRSSGHLRKCHRRRH